MGKFFYHQAKTLKWKQVASVPGTHDTTVMTHFALETELGRYLDGRL